MTVVAEPIYFIRIIIMPHYRPYLSIGANNAVAASCTCRCADLRSLCTMPINFIQPPPWLPMPPECHMIAASPVAKHHTTLKIQIYRICQSLLEKTSPCRSSASWTPALGSVLRGKLKKKKIVIYVV